MLSKFEDAILESPWSEERSILLDKIIVLRETPGKEDA
jgi:hypothetical protein